MRKHTQEGFFLWKEKIPGKKETKKKPCDFEKRRKLLPTAPTKLYGEYMVNDNEFEKMMREDEERQKERDNYIQKTETWINKIRERIQNLIDNKFYNEAVLDTQLLCEYLINDMFRCFPSRIREMSINEKDYDLLDKIDFRFKLYFINIFLNGEKNNKDIKDMKDFFNSTLQKLWSNRISCAHYIMNASVKIDKKAVNLSIENKEILQKYLFGIIDKMSFIWKEMRGTC